MARRENRGYTLGLYEKAMPGGLSVPEMLKQTREAGFDRLELSIDETDERLSRLEWPVSKRRELREMAMDAGVLIETICLSGHRRFPLGSHDEKIRERSLEILKRAVEFCAQTGVRIIQLAGYDVYYETGDEATRAWFLENLRKGVEIAARAGVLLGFETMETSFMDTTRKAMTYVDAIRSPYLGVYPDIGNLKNASVLYGSDLIDDLAAGEGHLFAAHLKETRPGIYRDLSFGEGHTEYIPCIKELWRQGVRMFTGEFWHLGEEDVPGTLARAGKFLREKIEAAMDEIERG